MNKALQFMLLALALGVFVACDDTKSGDNKDGGNKDNTENNTKAADATYNLDAAGAQVMWLGSKAEGAHFGTFALKSGQVMVGKDGISGGSAAIDLTSLTVMDEALPDDMKAKLKGHLSSGDFFDVATNPEISLKITGSSKYAGTGETKPEGLPAPMEALFIANPTHTITGTLNIKGQAKEISFPAEVATAGDEIKARAFFKFDRRAYGLRFQSDTEATVNPEIHIAMAVKGKK